MYYDQPYTVSQPVARPVRRIHRSNAFRSSPLRLVLCILCSLCALLVVATLITVIAVYATRVRPTTVSSLLNYPNFACQQRPCGCPTYTYGSSSLNGRIVGGKDALPYSYPWLVALTDRYRTDPFCAGFIISSNTILTAAHCLHERSPNQIHILSKIHDLRQFKGERHRIETWYIHPEYQFNGSTYINDIAMIKVQQPFGADLQPCCLPPTQSYDYPAASTTAVVSGWGKTVNEPNRGNSDVLQHVVMPVVDRKNVRCRNSIIDADRQLCAGYDRFSVDTCAGDSGAPLLVVERTGRQDGYFVVAGIVSYGNRQCDASLSSGVYTRVSFYMPWIRALLSHS